MLYEENRLLIENGNTEPDSQDYNHIIDITSSYALALSRQGNSQKSLQYLDRAIQLMSISTTIDLPGDAVFEELRWTRGYENYNQKNYKQAASDFEYLVAQYPDNDKYKK